MYLLTCERKYISGRCCWPPKSTKAANTGTFANCVIGSVIHRPALFRCAPTTLYRTLFLRIPTTPIIYRTFSRLAQNIRQYKPNTGWRSACASWLAAYIFKFVACITFIYLKFTCNGICVIKMMINHCVKQWFNIIWRLEESKSIIRLSLTRLYLKGYTIGLDLKMREQST